MHAPFITAVILVISFFLTSAFMYTHAVLILINLYLLNVFFSMTKALNSQNSSKQSLNFPTPFNAIWIILLLIMFILLFFPLSFYFKLYKVSPDPTPVVISWLAS